MLSRIYTPPVTPYSRPQGSGAQRGLPSATEENRQGLPAAQPQAAPQQLTPQPDQGVSTSASSGLQSVQYDRFQKIPLDAVLHDFRNTVTALGADDQTRSEVDAYLKVVSLQGNKEQPEVPFIKHALRTAAGTLDQYIAKALGQPSHVVKEWVDALLLQDIDFHSETPFQDASVAAPGSELPKVSAASTAESPAVSQKQLSVQEKSQLQDLITKAKSARDAQQNDVADQQIQAALALLDGKEQPDLEGKIWRLQGRFQQQDGQWEQSVSSYTQAAQCFQQANLPQKQADTLQAMASVLEDHGQFEQAKTAYQQALGLQGQSDSLKTQVRLLNDLGRVDLRLGNTQDAIQSLEKASKLSQEAQLSGQGSSDILSNLGAAYRKAEQFQDAAMAYQNAAQAAQSVKDKGRYTYSLQQYAAVLVEAGKPAQAMKALQRLSRLQA